MTISLFEARRVRFELSSEEEVANISVPGPKIKKIKVLYFLQLSKFEKAKWLSFFNHGPGAEIWPFSHLSLISY